MSRAIRWIAGGLLCHAATAFCQGQPGKLYGKVTDPKGAPVPNATITVRDCQDKARPNESTRTGADGGYALQGHYGDCSVVFTAQGFAPQVRSHVYVDADQNLRLDAALMIGGGSTVYVSVETGHLQMEKPDAVNTSIPLAVAPFRSFEFGVLTQGGFGVTENRGSFRFLMAGAHAGRVLARTGHGNFEYAMELFPFWQSYTPKFQRQTCLAVSGSPGTYNCSAPYTVGGTYTGASFTPIILRWNLAGTSRFAPWVQGAGGLLWTNHKYPAVGGPPVNSGGVTNSSPGANTPNDDTSVWNFTPQFGVGMHYFTHPNRSIDFAANAIHISSASLGDKNPGVNASVQFSVGYTWWK